MIRCTWEQKSKKYKKDNPEHKKAYAKEYYKKNKDKILEKRRKK